MQQQINNRPDTHTNNGGEQQPVEKDTQQFTSDGSATKSTAEKYKITSSYDEKSVAEALLNGKFGEKYKFAFARLNDKQKEEVIGEIKKSLDSKAEAVEANRAFKQMTYDDFVNIGKENKEKITETIANGDAMYQDFRSKYTGNGQVCFNFNKSLRMGWDSFAEWYKNKYSYNPMHEDAGSDSSLSMTQEGVEEFAKTMDTLTNAYQIPENTRTYRLVDDNYIATSFEDYLKDKLSISEDPQWGYKTIDRANVSVDQLYGLMTDLIGCKVKADGGFTSFSCVENASHMAKNQDPNTYKRILIHYDMPRGTKCLISDYEGESEGVFPRGTGFFIKNVEKQTVKSYNGTDLERLVLTLGIQR